MKTSCMSPALFVFLIQAVPLRAEVSGITPLSEVSKIWPYVTVLLVTMSCLFLKDYYYLSVKALYTVGYSTSLVSLTTAMVILCRFR